MSRRTRIIVGYSSAIPIGALFSYMQHHMPEGWFWVTSLAISFVAILVVVPWMLIPRKGELDAEEPAR